MPAKRKLKWLGLSAAIVVIGLVAARLALPAVVKLYVNHRLDENPNYDGHVDDIDLALIRGAYTITGIEIVKEVGEVPEPLFAADVVDLGIRWDALLRGDLVGEISVLRPRLNLVNGGAGNSQTGAETAARDWKQTVLDLSPFRIDRLTLVDGEIHYVDRTQEPAIDVAIDQVQAEVRNLTNSEAPSEAPAPPPPDPSASEDGVALPDPSRARNLVATIDGTGTVEGTGALTLAMRFDPFGERPTFDANLRVVSVALVPFNELFNRYGRFDFEAGTVDVNVELAAEDGKLAGYVKPILHDVKVVGRGDLREGNGGPLRVAWEVAVGATTGLLNNEKRDQLATRVPISGELSDPNVGIWPAAVAALRNAFVEALFNGLDDTIDLSDAAGGTTDGGARPDREARRDARKAERANTD